MSNHKKDDGDSNSKSKPSSSNPKIFGLGWFPEGSTIDIVDKKISKFVFRLQLGKIAEWSLCMPGCYFGLPVSAWCIAPLLITWYAEHRAVDHPTRSFVIKEDLTWIDNTFVGNNDMVKSLLQAIGVSTLASAEYLFFVCLPVTISYSTYFYACLYKGKLESAYRHVKYFMIPALCLFMYLGQRIAPDGYRAGCFFIVSWTVCQAISHFIKVTAARSRSLLSMHDELQDVHRNLPEVQTMLRLGQSAFESFPSGDSVGAASFSGALYALGMPFYQSAFFGGLTAFCRMYFHAHHLLDVTAGFAIGFLPTVAIAKVFGPFYFGPISVGMSLLSFIMFHKQSEKIKPTIPDEFKVEGRVGF